MERLGQSPEHRGEVARLGQRPGQRGEVDRRGQRLVQRGELARCGRRQHRMHVAGDWLVGLMKLAVILNRPPLINGKVFHFRGTVLRGLRRLLAGLRPTPVTFAQAGP